MKGLIYCLLGLLVIGLCSALPAGREFATSFMQNLGSDGTDTRFLVEAAALPSPRGSTKVKVTAAGEVCEREIKAATQLATMRLQWILSILSIIVSMGLLVIVMGQYQVLAILEEEAEKQQVKSKKLDDQLTNEDLFKVTIEKLMAQVKKVAVDLEATVAKLGPEMEKKKTENDACQAEKKTRNDELAEMQKVHTVTEAALKSESTAWNQEIKTLQVQLTGYRPICDHLENSSLAMKLCGVTTTLTPPLTKM